MHAIVQTNHDDTNHSGETGEDDHDRPPDEQFINGNLASLYHNLSLTRMFLLKKIKLLITLKASDFLKASYFYLLYI